MMKKLLSRLMGATKRKRSGAKWQRGLAFERMEDRLALSTTTGAELNLQIYSITTTQGGSVAFDNVMRNELVFLKLSGEHFQVGDAAVGVNLTAYISGADGLTVASAYNSNETANSRDFDSTILNSLPRTIKLTINQPVIGNVANSNGIVAIGAIFETQPLAKNLQGSTHSVAVASHQAAPELTPAIVPVNEVSMSRGREMYFDVAEVSADESRSRQADEKSTEERSTLARVSFNSFGGERERVRTASATTVPTNNSAKALKRGAQTDAIRTSAPAKAVLNAVPKVSEAELPALPQENSPQGEKVSATTARDQAFADWRRREFLNSDDILSARTDESDDDSSSWPILAALAVGGLVVRSRRLTASSLWHQQPPRRKKSAIL